MWVFQLNMVMQDSRWLSHRQDTKETLKKADCERVFFNSFPSLDASQREFKLAMQVPADVENMGKSTQLPTPCAIFDSNRLLTELLANDYTVAPPPGLGRADFR
jgi:hypothetical protein